MARLKLEGPCSFTGYGFRVTAQNPYLTTDDTTAAALIQSGLFVPAQDEATPEPESENGPLTTADTMTLAALRNYAKELGIPGAASMKRAQLQKAVDEARKRGGHNG